jgi:hypothetical protein
MAGPINLRKTVSALGTGEISSVISEEGIITGITMHFPPGCNSLVEARILYDSEVICPSSGDYIALDDASPTFVTRIPAKKGKVAKMELINHDDTYSHTISTIISIVPPIMGVTT